MSRVRQVTLLGLDLVILGTAWIIEDLARGDAFGVGAGVLLVAAITGTGLNAKAREGATRFVPGWLISGGAVIRAFFVVFWLWVTKDQAARAVGAAQDDKGLLACVYGVGAAAATFALVVSFNLERHRRRQHVR